MKSLCCYFLPSLITLILQNNGIPDKSSIKFVLCTPTEVLVRTTSLTLEALNNVVWTKEDRSKEIEAGFTKLLLPTHSMSRTSNTVAGRFFFFLANQD